MSQARYSNGDTMRRVAIVALMGCLLSWAAAASAQERIPWVADWREAREIAQQQHRLVLLHFYSDSCPPCRKLERDVFPRPEVSRALATGYVPVKINVERFPELREHYKVDAYPADVIVTAAGMEVARQIPSPPESNQYVAMLDAARAKAGVGGHMPARNAGQAPAAPPTTAATDSGYGNSGYGNSSYGKSSYGNSGYGGETAATSSNPGFSNPRFTSQAAAPPQSSQITNEYANDALAQPAPSQAAGVAPRYGNMYSGSGQGTAATANPYGQASQGTPGQPQGQSVAATGPYGSPSQPTYGAPGANAGPTTPASGYGDQYSGSAAGQANPFQGYQGVSQQAAAQPPTETQSAPAAQFAMDGFCPVTLVEHSKWQKGDARWGAVHEGKTYLFASQQGQQQFLAAPDRFAPILAGFDPVRYAETGQLVQGKREHGVFYGDRIFLFADEVALDRFSKHTNFYMDRVRQASATSPQQPARR